MTLSRFVMIVVPFVISLCGSLSAAIESDTVSFFRAIKDKKVYKTPSQFDRLVVQGSKSEQVYYVEKHAAYVIPATSISKITVKKTKKYGKTRRDIEKFVEETSGAKKPQAFPSGFFYSVNFELTAAESKKFSDFTANNKQDFFRTRIGNTNLNLTQFDLPFEPDDRGTLEFTVYLDHDDAQKIKGMLAPFKVKIVWE